MHGNCDPRALPFFNVCGAQVYALFLSPTIYKVLSCKIIEKNLVSSFANLDTEDDILFVVV